MYLDEQCREEQGPDILVHDHREPGANRIYDLHIDGILLDGSSLIRNNRQSNKKTRRNVTVHWGYFRAPRALRLTQAQTVDK
jgi:hypothetical protein